MKACEQNKYHDYHLKYGSEEFAIPFTNEFRQRNAMLFINPNKDSNIDRKLNEGTFNDDDQEELMAIQFPTNLNKSEDLAERVVGQKEERFKNK